MSIIGIWYSTNMQQFTFVGETVEEVIEALYAATYDDVRGSENEIEFFEAHPLSVTVETRYIVTRKE